ncbi:MAG: hypothetical protein ACPIOQ_22565 [Promethearchaeia archaeon]
MQKQALTREREKTAQGQQGKEHKKEEEGMVKAGQGNKGVTKGVTWASWA